ncbi:MAG: RNA polymerase sigma factor [Armatimonadetes bacterium]|nr:RNA polymerase sigma factor [Armatimonadota bacterium]
MDAEDRSLIEAFRRGEESAYTALVVKHRDAVYRIARRFLGNHEDAADIAQEVLIRVYKALPAFDGRCAFRTWLYRITVNLCIDHRDRWSRAPQIALDEVPREPVDDQDPAEAVAQRELGRQVARAIQDLPPRQRAAVVLRLYHDLPYADIARILECAEGTVKATMFAALAKLRRALAPHVVKGRYEV